MGFKLETNLFDITKNNADNNYDKEVSFFVKLNNHINGQS